MRSSRGRKRIPLNVYRPSLEMRHRMEFGISTEAMRRYFGMNGAEVMDAWAKEFGKRLGNKSLEESLIKHRLHALPIRFLVYKSLEIYKNG